MEWITFVNIIGLIGVILIVTMYIRLQIGSLSPLQFSYSLYNFIGAIAILFSLLFNWNLASVVIECVWMVASIVGMIKALKKKKESPISRFEIYKDPKNFSLVNYDQIEELKCSLKSWDCIENKLLKKRYNFDSYQKAKTFVDAVVQFAESVNHHPEMILGYKFVEISIWTHNVGGLSKVDFAYAHDLDDRYCV